MTPNKKLLTALADMASAQQRAIAALAEMQSTGWLSVKEYAEKYHLSASQVYKQLNAGVLKGHQVGSKWIVEDK